MLGDKQLLPVRLRKLVAGIKAHAQWRNMRFVFPYRGDASAATAGVAVLRVWNVAAMTVWIAEILAGMRPQIQLFRRRVLAQIIAAIVVKIQVAAAGLPIKTH